MDIIALALPLVKARLNRLAGDTTLDGYLESRLRGVQQGVQNGCGRVPQPQPHRMYPVGDCIRACPHQAIRRTPDLRATHKKELSR